jgi:hypothetical protein
MDKCSDQTTKRLTVYYEDRRHQILSPSSSQQTTNTSLSSDTDSLDRPSPSSAESNLLSAAIHELNCYTKWNVLSPSNSKIVCIEPWTMYTETPPTLDAVLPRTPIAEVTIRTAYSHTTHTLRNQRLQIAITTPISSTEVHPLFTRAFFCGYFDELFSIDAVSPKYTREFAAFIDKYHLQTSQVGLSTGPRHYTSKETRQTIADHIKLSVAIRASVRQFYIDNIDQTFLFQYESFSVTMDQNTVRNLIISNYDILFKSIQCFLRLFHDDTLNMRTELSDLTEITLVVASAAMTTIVETLIRNYKSDEKIGQLSLVDLGRNCATLFSDYPQFNLLME